MTAAAPPSLLARRLVIVTGKGGTGKTTVAAALAVGAARAGRRVLVAEVGRDPQVPRLLEPRPVGLETFRIDPFDALGEYLALQLGVRAPVDFVLRSQAFRQLMNASPGWRELITLGKVWHLEQMEEPPGSPRYDLIVVDAPATGHGVSFLDVPRVVVSAVRAGPLHQQTEQVEKLLRDRERSLLLPVTLAEELPTRETVELIEKVRGGIGVPVDRVVVNGVVPAPFPAGLENLDECLSRLPEGLALGDLPPPAELAAAARFLGARHALNRGYVDEVARATGLPIVRLPYRAEGIRGLSDVGALGEELLREPEARAA